MVEFSSGLKGMALNLDTGQCNLSVLRAFEKAAVLALAFLLVIAYGRGIHLRCPEVRRQFGHNVVLLGIGSLCIVAQC